jgi:hypothetical protein
MIQYPLYGYPLTYWDWLETKDWEEPDEDIPDEEE